MVDNEIKIECEKYKNALLYGKETKARELRSALQKRLPDAVTFFRDCDLWLKKCNELIDRAVAAAHRGRRRDSLDFDRFLNDSKLLGGMVTSCLCQQFDFAVKDYLNNNAEPALSIKEVSTSSIPQNALSYLNEIQKFASWGRNGEQGLKKNREQLLRLYPDSEKWIKNYIERGKKLKEYYDSAYNLGVRNGSPKVLHDIQKEMSQEGYKFFLCQKAEKSYNTGLSRAQRVRDAREYKPKDFFSEQHFDKFEITTGDQPNQKKETLSFTGIHPNSLCQLLPSRHWSILIDETGKNFSEEVYQTPNIPQKGKNQIGRIVGLFVPEEEETKLPPLSPGWHAVDNSLAEIEHVTESILTSKCGVLGVSVNAFSRVHADQWLFGIEALLDLAFRLTTLKQWRKQKWKKTKEPPKQTFRSN